MTATRLPPDSALIAQRELLHQRIGARDDAGALSLLQESPELASLNWSGMSLPMALASQRMPQSLLHCFRQGWGERAEATGLNAVGLLARDRRDAELAGIITATPGVALRAVGLSPPDLSELCVGRGLPLSFRALLLTDRVSRQAIARACYIADISALAGALQFAPALLESLSGLPRACARDASGAAFRALAPFFRAHQHAFGNPWEAAAQNANGPMLRALSQARMPTTGWKHGDAELGMLWEECLCHPTPVQALDAMREIGVAFPTDRMGSWWVSAARRPGPDVLAWLQERSPVKLTASESADVLQLSLALGQGQANAAGKPPSSLSPSALWLLERWGSAPYPEALLIPITLQAGASAESAELPGPVAGMVLAQVIASGRFGPQGLFEPPRKVNSLLRAQLSNALWQILAREQRFTPPPKARPSVGPLSEMEQRQASDLWSQLERWELERDTLGARAPAHAPKPRI